MPKEITLKLENSRTYHYPSGEDVYFPNVRNIRVSTSGTHYLTYVSSNGAERRAIVMPGWLWIGVEAEAWEH